MPPASSLLEFLESPASQRLALALAHFLWQGAALGVLTWCLFRWPRRLGPQGRYRLGSAALLVLVVCPLVTFAVCEPPSQPAGNMVSPIDETTASTSPPALLPPEARPVGIRESTAHLPLAAPSEPTAWQEIRPWLLSVWLFGVLLLSGRLVVGTWTTWRLRRSARPCPAEWRATADRLARRFGFRRVPRIGVSDTARDALAVGLWRPLIVLPAAWVWRLPPDVCEAVLAHELAHVRRWDLWVNLLQRLAETLLFYHPAVWWLSGSLRRDRELCCDALAVVHTDDPLRYAKALETVARLPRRTGGEVEPVLALRWGGRRMRLLERVRHVLGQEGRGGKLERWSAGVLAIALPLALWAGAVTLAPASADDAVTTTAGSKDSESAAGEGSRDRDRSPKEEILSVNREKHIVRIGLGSADGLKPRTRLHVYYWQDPAADQEDATEIDDSEREQDQFNFVRANVKLARVTGTIEVVRVLGDHLAEARIVHEDAQYPISKGDPIARAALALIDWGDGDRPDGDHNRDRDRPRDGEREDGNRPRDGEREDGDRPRDGEREDGGRPRDGERDRDRPRDGEREGERGPRGEERSRDDRPRDGERESDRPRFRDGERPFPPGPQVNRELIEMIRELRREVELLRREVQALRGQRGDRSRGEGMRDAARPFRDRPRDGEGLRDGDRPRDGERPDNPLRLEREDREFSPRSPEADAERPDAERPEGEEREREESRDRDADRE